MLKEKISRAITEIDELKVKIVFRDLEIRIF